MICMSHRLTFKSGIELPKCIVGNKSHYDKRHHTVEKVRVTEHYEIPYSSYSAEAASLGKPSNQKSDCQCYSNWCVHGSRSLLREKYWSRCSSFAELRSNDQKYHKHHCYDRHYISCTFFDLIGSSQAVSVPEEHYPYDNTRNKT